MKNESLLFVMLETQDHLPSLGIVENVAPWMITVGASTTDRLFTTYMVLGDKRHIKVLF